MSILVSLVSNVVVLIVAFKLYFWARRKAKAGYGVWRRRVGLTFLFAPVLLTIGRAISLPDVLLLPLEAIGVVAKGIDLALQSLLGLTKEHLDGVLAMAVKPLCYAIVYGGLGVLVGWPLDKRRELKERERLEREGASPPGLDDHPPPTA
jgi:hypothetical protein